MFPVKIGVNKTAAWLVFSGGHSAGVGDLPIALPGNRRIWCRWWLRKPRAFCAWEFVGGGCRWSGFVKFLLQVLGDRIPGRCNKTPGPSAAVEFPCGGLCLCILPSSLFYNGSLPRSWEVCSVLGCWNPVAMHFVLTAPFPKTQTSEEFTAWSRLLDVSAMTVVVSDFSPPEEERREGRYSRGCSVQTRSCCQLLAQLSTRLSRCAFR